MAERSIIVKGHSLDDALSKGLFLLGVGRDDITYEVLQEGSRGRGSLLGTPYRLRITAGGSKPLPAAGEAPLPLPAFGAAMGEVRPEELEALSPAEFIALLDRVEQSVCLAPPVEEGMAPVPGASAIDGEVSVEVAPSRMEAFVTVTPAHGGGREATTADVDAALAASGVRYGIDAAAVAEAVARCATRTRVAVGLAPRAGADGRVRYVTTEGGLTDEVPVGREVTPETVVAVKVPPAEGAPGSNVLGERLPPHLGRDVSLHAAKGKSLRVSDDGRELIATASGIVSVVNGKVQVESALVLERDVTSAMGSVHFNGDILIQGSVLRGVSVTAGGSVLIRGNVDVAIVQAEGDVSVGGGILGRGMGTVRAGGAVTCRFVQEAKVRAGADIAVEDYVRGGDLQADRRVTVSGSVIGGQVYGVQGVRVRSAGTEQGVTTTLAAGPALRIREDAERIRLRVVSLSERLAAVEASAEALLAAERGGSALPPAQRLTALKAVEERARLRREIEHLTTRRAGLIAGLDAAQPATVSVTHKAFAGTRVLIDEAALELTADTQYANFTKDPAASAIRLTALT